MNPDPCTFSLVAYMIFCLMIGLLIGATIMQTRGK